MEKNVPLVIYHHPCLDGIAAAWVVWKFFAGAVELYPSAYGKEPPLELIRDRQVYIVDFSYKAPVMKRIIDLAKRTIVLDHHKTAKNDLAEISGGVPVVIENFKERDEYWAQHRTENGTEIFYIKFDMNESGASLAWKYFFPNEPLPRALEVIKQGDIYQFTEDKDYIITLKGWMMRYPLTVESIDEIVNKLKLGINIYDEAVAIKRAYDRQVEEIVDTAFPIQIDEFEVPCANCPGFMASAVAGKLSARAAIEGTSDYAGIKPAFGISYFQVNANQFQFSLRSSDKQEDVSEIAKRFGGGGHRNAAGFTIASDKILWNKHKISVLSNSYIDSGQYA